jgi:membrane protein DedA with SNARE-associated domain
MSEPTTAPSRHPTHPRWFLPLLGASIVALVIANNVGNAVWARWIESNPIGLLALNSSNKYLLGTSIVTEFWPYLTVATLRLLAADPLFYLLGFLYRDRALHWALRVFPGIDPVIDQFQQDRTTFKKALNVLVVIMPNNPVCLLAGVAAMPALRFAVLNVLGTVGRVVLLRQVGFLFEDQIRDVLDVVARYQVWLTRGSIALVVAYLAWQTFGRRGLVGGVETLEEELGED